ncbi:hypothetical protein HNR46_003561 [Haloferula luteola]|uniref:Uncharacterized protein n=1 Tax=Haloferula luteola TaxID=595692 RepID=A0A840V8C7_9BACT|nr:hypothetical protein [Haloferula luteola]MBB5353306.1 hypothetical protein [Haloferula luteola]
MLVIDDIQEGHESFRFGREIQEHGIGGAIFRMDDSHIDSRFLSIHHAAILLLLFLSTVILRMKLRGSGRAAPLQPK